MKTGVISWIFLVTTGGCSAIFPIEYFSSARQQLPQQPIFYKLQRRQFYQQQPYALSPTLGQLQNFPRFFANAQREPHNIYDAHLSFDRELFASALSDPYYPILRYIFREPPIQPAFVYAERPLVLQRPSTRDTIMDCEHNGRYPQIEKVTKPETLVLPIPQSIRQKLTDTQPAMRSKPETLQAIIAHRMPALSVASETKITTVESSTEEKKNPEPVTAKPTISDPEITCEKSSTAREAIAESFATPISEHEKNLMKFSTTRDTISEAATTKADTRGFETTAKALSSRGTIFERLGTKSATPETKVTSRETTAQPEPIFTGAAEQSDISEAKTSAKPSTLRATAPKELAPSPMDFELENVSTEILAAQEVLNTIADRTRNEDTSFTEKMQSEPTTAAQILS